MSGQGVRLVPLCEPRNLIRRDLPELAGTLPAYQAGAAKPGVPGADDLVKSRPLARLDKASGPI